MNLLKKQIWWYSAHMHALTKIWQFINLKLGQSPLNLINYHTPISYQASKVKIHQLILDTYQAAR